MHNSQINVDDFIEVINPTKIIIVGTLIGLISVFLVSLLCAALIVYNLLPIFGLKWVSIIILFVSNFIGAYKAAKIYKKNGMIVGMIVGISVLLIIILSGLLLQTISFEVVDLSLLLVKLFGLLLFGAIGGILGINLNY